jgi:hypothetical protein
MDYPDPAYSNIHKRWGDDIDDIWLSRLDMTEFYLVFLRSRRNKYTLYGLIFALICSFPFNSYLACID